MRKSLRKKDFRGYEIPLNYPEWSLCRRRQPNNSVKESPSQSINSPAGSNNSKDWVTGSGNPIGQSSSRKPGSLMSLETNL